MRMIALFLLLISATCFSSTEDDYKCVVISGLDKDWNGAVHKSEIMKTSSIRGKKCEVYDSWLEFYKVHNGKSSGKILIYQGAHGMPGGSAACNAGDESPEVILDVLLKITNQGYHIGLLNLSCYSGDLLKKLIAIQASATPNEKLCILTDSYIDRPATIRPLMSSEAIEQANDGESLNDVFLRMSGGMTSAAAWSDSNFDYRFAQNLYLDPSDILTSLESYSASCQNQSDQSHFISYMGEADFETKKRVSTMLTTLNSGAVLKRKDLSKMSDIDHFIETVPENKDCLKKIRDEMINSLYKNKEDATYLDILQLFENFSPPTECAKLKFSKKFVKENSTKYINDNSPLSLKKDMKAKDLLAQILLESVTSSRDRQRINALSLLFFLQNISVLNKKQFDINIDTGLLINKTQRASLREEGSAEKVLKSIEEGGTEVLSPLDAFMKGSLIKPSKNPKDVLRYKACEDFKL
jgi:hypothetical protein